MKALFSAGCWKRPWPNLDEVSMNLSSIFSKAARFVWTSKDCGENKHFNQQELQHAQGTLVSPHNF